MHLCVREKEPESIGREREREVVYKIFSFWYTECLCAAAACASSDATVRLAALPVEPESEVFYFCRHCCCSSGLSLM